MQMLLPDLCWQPTGRPLRTLKPGFLFYAILIFINLTKKHVGGILKKEEVPEHRVISTFCEQPPSVGQTWAAIFLLFFIFQIREYCYNCSNYCGNTSYQSNNSFTSHTQASLKSNSGINCFAILNYFHFEKQILFSPLYYKGQNPLRINH